MRNLCAEKKSAQADCDDEVRDLLVRIIAFVAKSKAFAADKCDALDAVDALKARLLP